MELFGLGTLCAAQTGSQRRNKYVVGPKTEVSAAVRGFSVCEREPQEGWKIERATENQLRDQMTTNRSHRSGRPFEPCLCGSQPPRSLFLIHRSPPFHRR